MKVDSKRTYIGVVEENIDPKKLGRVKVRVIDVFEQISVEEIPWAFPWKDLNGNQFNVPDKGKVVMVVFDGGDRNSPEYIYADHYNVNLEKKLESLSESDYISMKSLMFDHKTQIYVNDKEGLKIDHKYNNINITENTVDINLKDNNRNINIGDATATQQAILGNHWMDWFDEFVDNLLGTNAGPFLGNLGAPVIPNPALISCLLRYKALRDPVFLSHHVNIVDNNKVTTVGMTKREDNPVLGDEWASTVQENTLTQVTDEDFKPVEGPKSSADPVTQPTPGSSASAITKESLSSIKSDPMIEKLVRFLQSKSYKVYEEPGILNIVAMRTKDTGTVTNKFDDILYVFYRKENLNWQILEYNITTVAGFIPNDGKSPFVLPEKVSIIAYGQFIDKLRMEKYRKEIPSYTDESGTFIPDQVEEYNALKFTEVAVYRNDKVDKYNYRATVETGDYNLWVKRASKTGSVEQVFNYSDNGSQVFKNINQYNQFMMTVEEQSKVNNNFTYTICRKSEFDDFIPDSDEKQKEKEQRVESSQPKAITGDDKLDIVIKRIGNAKVQKDTSGNRTVIVYYNENKNYIVFYNNGRFAIFDNPSQGWISKGSFDDGGRKLVVTDGAKTGKTFESDNFWETLKLYKK